MSRRTIIISVDTKKYQEIESGHRNFIIFKDEIAIDLGVSTTDIFKLQEVVGEIKTGRVMILTNRVQSVNCLSGELLDESISLDKYYILTWVNHV